MFGALPSRIARRSTGKASPSISRNTIPGTSVLAMIPCRRAIRCAMRIEDMSSEPRNTSITTLTAATTSAARSAQPKLSTLITPSVTASAMRRIAASAISTSRKPRTSVSGKRSAASKRRNDRVQRRDDRRDEQRTPEAVDVDTREESRRRPSRQRRWRATRRGAGTSANAGARASRLWTGRRSARAWLGIRFFSSDGVMSHPRRPLRRLRDGTGHVRTPRAPLSSPPFSRRAGPSARPPCPSRRCRTR